MIFYVETISDLSDRLRGPIDETSGFPTVHESLRIEADSIEQAVELAELRFTNNVLTVYEVPVR